MIMAKRIREARRKLKLTQEELGSLVHVTKTSICGYEKGNRNPNIETLRDLANVLNVSADYLLGIELYVGESEKPYGIELTDKELDFIVKLRQEDNLYKKLIEKNFKKNISELKKKNFYE